MTINRICFFNSNKAWGGGEKWHLSTAIAFRDMGFSPFLVANTGSQLLHNARKQGIEVYPIKVTNLSFANPAKLVKLSHFFKDKKPDGVILNLSDDAKLAGFAARLAGVSKIIYRRGLAVPVKNTFLNRFLYRKVVSHIIANSVEIKRTILYNNPLLVSEKKIHIIYNGVELGNYTKKTSQPMYVRKAGEIVLGNAGRLVEQKGQKYLIEAVSHLKGKGLKIKLLIAGTGPLARELKDQVKALGLEDIVIFLGFVDDMKAFMDSIDIFAFPSLHEGSSNAVIEAMACAKPLVAFKISSNPEMVHHNQTGFLAEFPDIGMFANYLEKLVRTPVLRGAFGEQGRRLAVDKFNRKKNLRQLFSILND